MTAARIRELRRLFEASAVAAAGAECLDEISRLMQPYARRFDKPSLAGVLAYAEQHQISHETATAFYDSYRGWQHGVRRWRRSLRKFEAK